MPDRVHDPFVIGTAGHVDHGKSALIMAITGVDPDRLPQEKQRGMTLELGFAYVELPSGATLNFVDVPGHDRFVATMVAGATGVEAGLLVIAADEGIKPQTREHVDILDLLDVRSNVIVISKSDLAGVQTLERLRREILELVAGTVLANAPILPVSARTREGLSPLLAVLATMSDGPTSTSTAPARLVVDRVFTMTGFGTVVTGQSTEPGFSTAEEVEIVPGGRHARVRGIQQNGAPLDSVKRGRTALNLAGVSRDSIHRGDVIAHPGTTTAWRRFDGRVKLLAHATASIMPNMLVTVHVGASAVAARVFPLTKSLIEAGHTDWAQFRLDSPVPLWRGQRFIVRQMSPALTIGGGLIGDVSPVRRAGDKSCERLNLMLSSKPLTVLLTLLERGALNESKLIVQSGFAIQVVRETLDSAEGSAATVRLGSRYFLREALDRVESRILAQLRSRRANSGTSFMSPQQLRHGLRVDPSEMKDLVEHMITAGSIVSAAQTLSSVGVRHSSLDEIGLAEELIHPSNANEAADDARVITVLEASRNKPPSLSELLQLCSVTDGVIHRLEHSGSLVRIADWLYLTPRRFDSLLQTVRALLESEGSMTVSRLREELQTSRKYAIAYLEYLDSLRITRRIGDERVKGKNFEQLRLRANSC